MTTLVAWLATDRRGPTSLYLASDSRISWKSADRRWDTARKLFACRGSPDLFGYCGDALFPSQALAQITEMIDHHLLFRKEASAAERHERAFAMIRASLAQRHRPDDSGFTIVHVARDRSGMDSSFSIWRSTYAADGGLADNLETMVDIGDYQPSRRLMALGTGAKAYVDETIRWDASAQRRTSRAYFTSLCDVLSKGVDSGSGGAPQLVGLYRTGQGRAFGIIHDGKRYFNGLPVAELDRYGSIEWRDDAFQRIDGKTLRLVKSAQRQVRPKLPDC